MANPVDICNLALSLLGEDAIITSINPPDGSSEAGHCSRWYPVALKKVFEDGNWTFATTTAKLVEMSAAPTGEHSYAYAMPSKLARVQCLLDVNLNPVPFVREVDAGVVVFLTDTPAVWVKFVQYVTSETVDYPIYFVECVVLRLAAYLVGVIRRTDTQTQVASNLLKQYEDYLHRALSQDVSSATHNLALRRIPSGIRRRSV